MLRMRLFWRLPVFGCALLALTLVSYKVRADSPGDPEYRDEPLLQEVTVTAQRRAEDIDKVPVSLQALTQREMDDLHIQNVYDLASIVPGLQLTPPSNFPDNSSITIRGIEQALGTAPTTQLYIDETPIAIRSLTESYSKSPYPMIFDLQRVEVLRGPQGTLFGTSAMGGAIRFITPQPSTTDSAGSAKMDLGYTEYGDRPTYELGASYGAPLAAGIAGYRVSAWFQSLGGFIDHEDPYTGQIVKRDGNAGGAYVVRPAMTFTPAEGLQITPAFVFQHQHTDNPDSYWVTELPVTEHNRHIWGGANQPYTDDLRVASLTIKYRWGNVAFDSDTSYLDRTSSGYEDTTHLFEYLFTGTPLISALPSFSQYQHNTSFTHAWQQEFRVSSQDASTRVNWVAGLFYRNAIQNMAQIQGPTLTPLTQYAFQSTQATSDAVSGFPDCFVGGQAMADCSSEQIRDVSEAIFADVAIELLRGLKLDAGVRYEHAVTDNHFATNVGGIYGGPIYATLADSEANPVTPRVSLTYQVSDSDMIYVSAAKGYRSGGSSLVSTINDDPLCGESLAALGLKEAPATFRSDSLWSYEFGTKDVFLDRRVSVQASAYYMKWADIQTSIGLPSCEQTFVGNRGEVVSRGVDLQLAALITPNLKLGATAGYTDAYYPSAQYGAPPVNSLGVSTGPAPLLHEAGDKLPHVAPWMAAVNAEYSFDLSTLWSDARSYWRVDYRWTAARSGQNPAVANYDPQVGPYPDPAYGVMNVRMGVTRNGLDLSAYVLNVTNSDPRLGLADLALGSPLLYATSIRPRTFGVTAWYRF